MREGNEKMNKVQSRNDREIGEWTRMLGTSHMIAARQVKNIRCVGAAETGEDGFLRASVITWHPLVLKSGYIIQGDIKSRRNVFLEDKSVVCGDITSLGSIFVGKSVCIFGSLHARKNIIIQEGAVIGRKEFPQKVFAGQFLKISQECRIYGTVRGANTLLK